MNTELYIAKRMLKKHGENKKVSQPIVFLAIIGIALGSLLIYICGVIGLILIINTSVSNAITIGVVPFIIGDVIKSILAVAVAYRLK